MQKFNVEEDDKPGNDDGSQQSFLHRWFERGTPGSPLVDLFNLFKNSVCPEHLATDLATQEDLLLVLPDGGHVARPDLQLVLLQENSRIFASELLIASLPG